MRIVIAGAGGLVGRALMEHCVTRGDQVFGYDHATLDIADSEAVETVIREAAPQTVINCAAWTDVDGCESDAERANQVNALGPENLAKASRQANALFITISTDYVFSGTREGFYTQLENPDPLSVYGHSKLEGERRAQLAHAGTVVVRTGYIFGSGGKNFLSTAVERARRGERLKAIHDSWGTPTYAKDLAVRLRELGTLSLPGIFHVVNSGAGATFEEFARQALELANCQNVDLECVSFESLKRPASRPRNSKLRCLLSEAVGLEPLPTWSDGLSRFVKETGLETGEKG